MTRYMENALKAQVIFNVTKITSCKDGEVIIVDEFTGRLMPGRRYSEGLHQAIEAKEGVRYSAKTTPGDHHLPELTFASTETWPG